MPLSEQPVRPPRPNGTWQRWQMASLDPRRQAVEASPPPPPIDEAELEALRDAARKDGYAQGHAQGYEQGRAVGHREGHARGLEAAHAEATRLQALAGNFSDALALADDEVAHALVTLALDVARELVRGTLRADPSAVAAAARELLEAEPALAGSPCLLLHPDDAELVASHLHGELQAAGWTVRTDPGVERGGCIATATSGEIDATLPTRWRRVVGALGRSDPWEPPHD